MVTDQLEVSNTDCTLVVHLFLVFVLNQTLHQITRIDLVISYILSAQHSVTKRYCLCGQITHFVEWLYKGLCMCVFVRTWQWAWMTGSQALMSRASIWTSCSRQ